MKHFHESRHAVEHPLSDKIYVLENCFGKKNLERLMKDTDVSSIKRYYRFSRAYYKNYVNPDGCMHFPYGKDFFGPVKEIAKMIETQSPRRVLELGSGNGANSAFLAEQFPEIQFDSIDLHTAQIELRKNQSHKAGDYHQLTSFFSGKYDFVFSVESVCHSNDWKTLFDEVSMLLNPGASFVMVDIFVNQNRDQLDALDQRLIKFMEKGISVDGYHSLEELYGIKNFTVESLVDYTDQVLHFSKYLENKSTDFYTSNRFKAWLCRNFLSYSVLKNSVSGLLIYSLFKGGLISHQFAHMKYQPDH